MTVSPQAAPGSEDTDPKPATSDDVDPSSRSHLTLRHDLHARFGPAQVGVSADGRTAHLTAPVDAGLGVGLFAVLEGEDDDGWTSLVVQVRSMSVVDREGPQLEVGTAFGDADLTVTSATVRPMLRALTGTGIVLGVIEDDGFTRCERVNPFGERIVRSARPEEIAVIAVRAEHRGGDDRYRLAEPSARGRRAPRVEGLLPPHVHVRAVRVGQDLHDRRALRTIAGGDVPADRHPRSQLRSRPSRPRPRSR